MLFGSALSRLIRDWVCDKRGIHSDSAKNLERRRWCWQRGQVRGSDRRKLRSRVIVERNCRRLGRALLHEQAHSE